MSDASAIAYVNEDTDEIVGFFSLNGLMARRADNARVYEDGYVPRWDFAHAMRLLVRPHPFDHIERVNARIVHWEAA